MSEAVIAMVVCESLQLNPAVRQLRLRAVNGSPLPGFTAGAHIPVRVKLHDGSLAWRHYSLIDLHQDSSASREPQEYVIAVLLEAQGRGGSSHMHALRTHDLLLVQPPKNAFALQPCDNDGRSILVAGGIGVTPLTSMATACRREKRGVHMHYAGRQRALLAFLPELRRLLGKQLDVHVDEEAGHPLDVDKLLGTCHPRDHLYVCGPKPMLDAVLDAAVRHDWPLQQLHFELFNAPPAQSTDAAFEVELAASGKRFTVSADQTLLDGLIAAGCDPIFDCQRGECGVCTVGVRSGDIDHRDYVLTAAQRNAGNLIQACVSRARGPLLVLDL